MKRRVAVRAIVVYDGKLLCVRLNNYAGSIMEATDYWCLPGGGVEEGEALIPALRREVVEELGPKPDVGSLLYIQQFIHGDTEHLEFFFHVKNALDYEKLDLASTSHGVIEIAAVEFIDPQSTTVLPKFLQHELIAEHIANSGPAKIFSFVD